MTRTLPVRDYGSGELLTEIVRGDVSAAFEALNLWLGDRPGPITVEIGALQVDLIPSARFVAPPPAWALRLVERVAADLGWPLPPLSWAASGRATHSTGVSVSHEDLGGQLHVTAGRDALERRLTLVHELAHWSLPPPGGGQQHGAVFYDQAFTFYRRYRVPLWFALLAEGAAGGMTRALVRTAVRHRVPGAKRIAAAATPAHNGGNFGDRNGSRTHPERRARGERNGNAKLTAQQVREIRRRYSAGELQMAIAPEFGITNQTVSKIVRGLEWAHV